MPRAPKNIAPRITPAVVRAFYAKLPKKGEPDYYVLEKGLNAIHGVASGCSGVRSRSDFGRGTCGTASGWCSRTSDSLTWRLSATPAGRRAESWKTKIGWRQLFLCGGDN
jgi:hypothetical protein